ncbi:MAG: hypothetical protein WC529_07845 [Candidatus Margulisiibacteriota bacterium]
MKRTIALLLLALLFAVPALALTKAELKSTYQDMSLEDLNELSDITFKIVDDAAKKTGYVPGRFSMGGAGGLYYFLPNASINDNKPAQAQSISSLTGGAGGFMVNMTPQWAVGGLFGGLGGGSTNKVGADYYTYTAGAAFELVAAQYKPIINDNFIVGLDLGLGLAQGGYTIDVTNENLTGQDIIRSGTGLAYLIGLDVRKRFTSTFFFSTKLGYFSAAFDTLKRGDFTDPGKSLKISAPYLSLGLGGNF